MHILLTDVLACPRCGPPYGLILVPDEVSERRVRSGFLGCANCRERYPIRDGVADLRIATEPAGPATGYEGQALRLAALLGVTEGSGTIMVAGPGAVHAAEIASLVPEVEVLAAGTSADPLASGPGVSAILLDERLPVQNGKLRAVALTGSAVRLLDEAARAVAPAGRVVVEAAEAADRLASVGLALVARDETTVVAIRSR